MKVKLFSPYFTFSLESKIIWLKYGLDDQKNFLKKNVL